MKYILNRLIPVDPFEEDDFPGKPKILFIGLPNSSHTHSWIDLLAGMEFNIRLFSSDYGAPPQDWEVRTYVTSPASLEKVGKYWDNLHQRYKRINILIYPLAAAKWGLNIFARRFKLPELYYDYTPKAESTQAWLAQIIRDWKPDIIHTLGVDHNQGGLFFYQTLKQMKIPKKWTWVVQLRGGSDLTLNRHDPEKAPLIREVLQSCDQIISDNLVNIEYVAEMGIPREKFASITPVPGTGGIDVNQMSVLWNGSPSQRRIVIFPKAYELTWSKSVPVIEAIILCWKDIQPCRIYFYNVTPEFRQWYNTLPDEIRQNCILFNRVERNEFINILANARVLVIPSLVDGIPNSLYEAMACGAFPIVSPLDTIQLCFKNENNVLYARNLYPQEIADALIRAMNDDALVDRAAQNNLELVKKLANRATIRERVVTYYQLLSRE